MNTVRIGTRGSKLALVQAEAVQKALLAEYSGINIKCEIVVIKTAGDMKADVPITGLGGKGAFVEEFERALAACDIDLAVHSAKDLPVELLNGLEICGVLKRADPRDVLVIRRENTKAFNTNDKGSVPIVGTGSLRRQEQLKKLIPGVECIQLRGNVDSRIRRLKNGELDGLVLAAAGLKRLGYTDDEELYIKYFSVDEMVPAAGQGIIAVEGRTGDNVSEMLSRISDRSAKIALHEERRAMSDMGADCHEAVGAYFDGSRLLIYKSN